MSRCKDCNCICHCSLNEHSDSYGVCSCTACTCGNGAEDSTYENETNTNGIVIDDTNECENCQ